MIQRYTLPKMGKVWTLESKFKQWLAVELAAIEAQNKRGLVSDEDLKNIKNKADFSVKEIKEIEDKVDHDVIAFLTNVSQYVGRSSRYIHVGLTSSDVVDTANSCLMRKAGLILLDSLDKLVISLKDISLKYKDTSCIGRTHGIHAELTTFGLKTALWYDEMQRNKERLEKAIDTISVGQISGAVGNYALIDPYVEEYVCKKLNLKPVNIATQIVQRDRYAQFITTLAIIGTTIEKIATEIRALQRTEIHEIEEGFSKEQKGSSAMPHKKNPILCERLCGLARLLRGYSTTSLENNALWHERDISHSSTERVIIPDSTTILHYMLEKTRDLILNLRVFTGKMKENIEITNGLIFSGSVLLELIKKDISRDDAYEIVQRNAMKCWETGESFKEILMKDKDLTDILNKKEIDAIFSIDKFLHNVDFIFKRVFK